MKAGRLILFLVLWSASATVVAASITVQNLRMWRAPDNTRLVFDMSGSVQHQVLVLENPDRIVIDLSNAQFRGALPPVDAENPLLTAIRTGRPEEATLRFVLDVRRAVKIRSFVLKPVAQYGHRLVVDLIDPQAVAAEEERVAAEAQAPAVTATPIPAVVPAITETAPPVTLEKREYVIAIDAGHGGEDPGALGRRYRTKEKDVTLAIARKLTQLVRDESGMRSVLIRDGDYYVDLRQRHLKAKKNRADVFISIHADALPGRRVAFGSSVYALSERGATHALAQALADDANYSELIGGVDLSDKPPDVVRTLLDLSKEKSIEHGLQLAGDVLSELGGVGRVHLSQVAQANFAVLKAPEIPSILVETAFISTPAEEKNLRDAAYQQRLAAAILKGVKKYLARNGDAPPLQRVASDSPLEHVVRAGDTLRSVARQYNVSVDVLRFLNELSSDDLPVGFRLRLPPAQGG